MTYGSITLRSGDLAYYDSFSGLLPCKVLSITGPSGNPSSSQTVSVKLTASIFGAGVGSELYKRGEILESSGLRVVARRAVHGKYKNRIRLFEVIADEPKVKNL